MKGQRNYEAVKITVHLQWAWLWTNQLSFNVGKSHVMLIGSRHKLWNSDLCVFINGRQLSQVPSLKYLSVYIDKWQKLVYLISMFIRGCSLDCIVSIILYHSCPLSNELLGKLCCTFILPILDYCDVVWSSSSVQYLVPYVPSLPHVPFVPHVPHVLRRCTICV